MTEFIEGIKALKTPRKTVVKVTGFKNSKLWINQNALILGAVGRQEKLDAFKAQDDLFKSERVILRNKTLSKAAQKASDCDKLKNSDKYPLYLKRLFYGRLCN